MDEYNRNHGTEHDESGEQTTPFQTPVRGAEESGSQSKHDNGASSGNPYRTGEQNTGSSSNPYRSGGTGTDSGANKYSGWGPSPSGSGGKRSNKKMGNGPKIAIAAVIVAAIGFAGGMAASSGLYSRTMNSSTQTEASVAESSTETSENSNSTKLQISDSKTTGSGESADDGQTSTSIYKTVSPSIVSIVVDDITVGSEASGSGVIMSKDGYIITNQHVVADGNKYTVILSDNTQYVAELVGADEKTDLAVLKIDPKEDLTAAEFGSSDALQVGDRCYAIGSPGGVEFQNTFTGGYISAIDRDVTINDRVMTLIQTDTAINPGSSGGALINSYSQVIGITSSKLSSSSEASYEGMGFAIPMSTVQEIVDQLIANGKVTGRPAIGISGYDISAAAAQYYDVPQGVLISSVNTDSDAYQQGLQANDIITAVDGKDITCMSDINSIKEEHKAGDSITLTIYRSGKTKKYKITLMDEADLDTSNSTANNSSENSNGESSQGNGGYGYYFGDGNYGNGYGNGYSNGFGNYGY